jgi:hypothetical protein
MMAEDSTMKYGGFEVQKVTEYVPKQYIKIDRIKRPLQLMIDLMDELDPTLSHVDLVPINDEELRQVMEEMRVIDVDDEIYCRAGEDYRSFREAFDKLVDQPILESQPSLR